MDIHDAGNASIPIGYSSKHLCDGFEDYVVSNVLMLNPGLHKQIVFIRVHLPDADLEMLLQCLEETPRKNFFYLSDLLIVHLTALGELYNACRPVDPEYAESWSSLFGRVIALFVPGVGGHSPVNYVNAVRLGPAPLVAKLTGEIHEIDQTLHKWEEKARGFVYRLYSKCFRRS